jgi:hypothetical protein
MGDTTNAKLVLRLPPELHAAAREAAYGHRLSLNSYIAAAVDEKIRREIGPSSISLPDPAEAEAIRRGILAVRAGGRQLSAVPATKPREVQTFFKKV